MYFKSCHGVSDVASVSWFDSFLKETNGTDKLDIRRFGDAGSILPGTAVFTEAILLLEANSKEEHV